MATVGANTTSWLILRSDRHQPITTAFMPAIMPEIADIPTRRSSPLRLQSILSPAQLYIPDKDRPDLYPVDQWR